ncbi:hypothetical protein Fmac_029327 [Flemingia macrophylla]|uniref:Acyltransferase n=1 Tax=Flemingia macrophylla TaxID=520843 RepID=A0ABD1LAJ8_9FABA
MAVHRIPAETEKETQLRSGLKEYLEHSKEFIEPDGGPPRWFSPLECASRMDNSPLLLFLPDLVRIVERTVRSEFERSPNRAIYLVGESLGACLALAVAALNPDIDLVLADILPKETLLWKLKLLKSASSYARSRLHAIKAQTLILCSLLNLVSSPVTLSTLEDGMIVKGLAGIPSEGPVLFVGYHMLLGLEKVHLCSQMYLERNIIVRAIAHPMFFMRSKNGKVQDLSHFDHYRIMGATPVSPTNLFKLFSSKSHVLLYPGGIREAFHRKGEEYKLFWPEQSEFVRMAARFGAKIVPFGAIGEDDMGEILNLVMLVYLKEILQRSGSDN